MSHLQSEFGILPTYKGNIPWNSLADNDINALHN